MSHGAAIPLRTLHTAFPHERHCAEQGSGADAQQPLLVPRSGSWARLTASVRLRYCTFAGSSLSLKIN